MPDCLPHTRVLNPLQAPKRKSLYLQAQPGMHTPAMCPLLATQQPGQASTTTATADAAAQPASAMAISPLPHARLLLLPPAYSPEDRPRRRNSPPCAPSPHPQLQPQHPPLPSPRLQQQQNHDLPLQPPDLHLLGSPSVAAAADLSPMQVTPAPPAAAGRLDGSPRSPGSDARGSREGRCVSSSQDGSPVHPLQFDQDEEAGVGAQQAQALDPLGMLQGTSEGRPQGQQLPQLQQQDGPQGGGASCVQHEQQAQPWVGRSGAWEQQEQHRGGGSGASEQGSHPQLPPQQQQQQGALQGGGGGVPLLHQQHQPAHMQQQQQQQQQQQPPQAQQGQLRELPPLESVLGQECSMHYWQSAVRVYEVRVYEVRVQRVPQGRCARHMHTLRREKKLCRQ